MTAPPSSGYPLQWPAGYPRTPAHKRRRSPFTSHGRPLTVADGLARLQSQLDLLRAKSPVLSSNLELRLDGLPRSAQANPSDPGVAVYFQLRGKATCMPCDAFATVADNIAAIAHHIDAVRRIERYGVASVEQMFTGFQAIRTSSSKPWRETFGFKLEEAVTAERIRVKHRELAMRLHPDVNGSIPGADSAMAELNAARDAALEELRQ